VCALFVRVLFDAAALADAAASHARCLDAAATPAPLTLLTLAAFGFFFQLQHIECCRFSAPGLAAVNDSAGTLLSLLVRVLCVRVLFVCSLTPLQRLRL
jgi:hypothetical protein